MRAGASSSYRRRREKDACVSRHTVKEGRRRRQPGPQLLCSPHLSSGRFQCALGGSDKSSALLFASSPSRWALAPLLSIVRVELSHACRRVNRTTISTPFCPVGLFNHDNNNQASASACCRTPSPLALPIILHPSTVLPYIFLTSSEEHPTPSGGERGRP